MKTLFPVLLILVLLSLTGCNQIINDSMQKWMHHTETELVTEWGAPDNVYVTQDSTRILTYKVQRNGYAHRNGTITMDKATGTGTINTTTYGGNSYFVTRTFVVKKGEVVDWSWDGY